MSLKYRIVEELLYGKSRFYPQYLAKWWIFEKWLSVRVPNWGDMEDAVFNTKEDALELINECKFYERKDRIVIHKVD